MCHTLCITTHGGTRDGTDNPSSRPTATQTLTPLTRYCPTCGNTMWAASHNYRTITPLTDVLRLTRKIRHCIPPDCPQVRHPYRPEAAGRLVLPKHECGLDIIALVGPLRHAQHRRVPEIPQELARRRLAMAPRTVRHLLERYDELVALSLADPLRLQRVTKTYGRVILALDGLQPDVGHEVLWVVRDCLSSEGRLARSLLSATQDDLATLLREVKQALGVPIVGVIPQGSPPAAAPSPKPWELSRISAAISPPCVKRPNPSMRPTATPRRRAKSGSAACAPLHGSWHSGRTLKPRSPGATATPCAVRSPTMATRPWPPRAHAAPGARHLPASGAGRKQGAVPRTLARLQGILQRGLTETASLWPEVRGAIAGCIAQPTSSATRSHIPQWPSSVAWAACSGP